MMQISDTPPPTKLQFGGAFHRMQSAYRRVGLAPAPAKVVVVAGTNGKGSFCRSLEVIALAHGLNVGLYSSPHLLEERERIRLQGRSIDEKTLAHTLEQQATLAAELELSFFERMTLAAVTIFSQASLDLWILEVGIGGRCDAVNVIDPDLSVITTIAHDHTHLLGESLEEIALEKSGILRPGQPALILEPKPPSTLIQRIQELSVPAAYFNQAWQYEICDAHWRYCVPSSGLQVELLMSSLPILSVSGALYAYERLGWTLKRELLNRIMLQLSLPGRMQYLRRRPDILVDVAHNPQSMHYLFHQLANRMSLPTDIICAMLKEKDIEQALSLAASLPRGVRWILPTLQHPRACESNRLAQALSGLCTVRCASVAEAIECSLKHLPANGLQVITGSFVTVGEALRYFGLTAEPEPIVAGVPISTATT